MIKAQFDIGGIKKLQATLAGQGGSCPPFIDRAMRSAALAVYGEVYDRVFNQTGAVNEKGKTVGPYKSESYLRRRQKIAKRSNRNINFVFTGDLSRAFIWQKSSSGCSYELGFLNPLEAEKYKHLRERFGNFLGISQQEAALASTVLIDELKKALR